MAWMKRINAPKWWPIERKKSKYIVVPRGAHKMKIPLQVVIRDVLKLADNAKEARSIIKSRKVLVDGRPRTDIKYGVGPMDVISIPTINKNWRAVPRNGLTFIEIDKDSNMKLCKILDKKILKKAITQLNLSDGRNILTNDNYSTNDSLLIELPSQKILDVFPMKKGNTIIVTGGKYEGIVSKIEEIDKQNKRVWIIINDTKKEIPLKYVTVVGKDEPAIKIE
ncbi:MAG: 30S ribosomal protein S4e [Candidatus Aenigmarchaeota archaeon]|nr:30S ribosomal protein S4e [Candidatus Aenigmarchaeota archaeon]